MGKVHGCTKMQNHREASIQAEDKKLGRIRCVIPSPEGARLVAMQRACEYSLKWRSVGAVWPFVAWLRRPPCVRSATLRTSMYVRRASKTSLVHTWYVYTRFKDDNRYQVRGTYEYVRTIWQRCTRVLTRHMYTHMYQVSYIPRVVFIILRSINYHGYASHLDHGSVRIFVVGTLMLHRSQVPGPRYDAAEL